MDAHLINWLWIAIGAGLLAVIYGAVSAASINRLDAGNARMQEIAAAIQAGAQAYLNRQYSTIAVVGVVLCLVLGLALDWATAGGFAVGAIVIDGLEALGRSDFAAVIEPFAGRALERDDLEAFLRALSPERLPGVLESAR